MEKFNPLLCWLYSKSIKANIAANVACLHHSKGGLYLVMRTLVLSRMSRIGANGNSGEVALRRGGETRAGGTYGGLIIPSLVERGSGGANYCR
jgi:hypothetical protein